MRGSAIVVVALIAGCVSKSPAKCRAEAEELERFMKSVDRHHVPFEVRAPMRLAVRDDLPDGASPYAEAIEVFRDHWEVSGTRYDSIAALGERLAQVHGRGPKGQDPNIVYVAIDRAVTWNTVVATFEAAHDAGFTKQLFVFAGSKPQAPPPPSKLDGELDAVFALEPEARGNGLGRIFGRFAEQCPAMHKPFINYGSEEKRDRTTILIEDTTKDLITCHCKVDIPSLRAAMWRLIAAPIPLKIVAIEATPPGGSPSVLLAAKFTSWGDVSQRFHAGLTKAWLAAEP